MTSTPSMPATTARERDCSLLMGKVAIVTGSTSGIGLSIAQALAGSGCAVMLNGLGERSFIEQQRSSLARLNAVEVRYHGANAANPNELQDLVKYTVEELGTIDILVNNAGIQYTSAIESFPADKWDEIIAINLSAPFHLIKAALPHMRRRGWGRIVNLASVHGLVASAEKAAYVTAKHGLVGLTKVVALETAASGITCNAICPGWVLTPLVQTQITALAQKEGISFDDAASRLLSEKQPTGRFVEVEQIADLTLFLCSHSATNITGSSIAIDGAWTAR